MEEDPYPEKIKTLDEVKFFISNQHFIEKKHYKIKESRPYKYYITCTKPNLCNFRINYNFNGEEFVKSKKGVHLHTYCSNVHDNCCCYSLYMFRKAIGYQQHQKKVSQVCRSLEADFESKIEYSNIYAKLKYKKKVDISNLELLHRKFVEEDPESLFHIEYSGDTFVSVIFIDKEWKRMFPYQKKLIFLDGCHLSGKQRGILYSATTLDANNKILPLGIIDNNSRFFYIKNRKFRRLGCFY